MFFLASFLTFCPYTLWSSWGHSYMMDLSKVCSESYFSAQNREPQSIWYIQNFLSKSNKNPGLNSFRLVRIQNVIVVTNRNFICPTQASKSKGKSSLGEEMHAYQGNPVEVLVKWTTSQKRKVNLSQT